MNAELQDPERQQPDVTNEQALQWYKNMLTGIAYVPRSTDTTDMSFSQHSGQHHDRSSTTRTAEFLHG